MPDKLSEIDVLARAKAAGLEKAVERFPDEVRSAEKAAAHARQSFAPPGDPTVEPWPPMHTGDRT